MDAINSLIVCLKMKNLNNKDKYVQRLKEIEQLTTDLMNYNEEFVLNLNQLLSQEEKFSETEYNFLLKFSKLTPITKKYFISNLTDQEKQFFDSIKLRVEKSILSYNGFNSEIDIKTLIKKIKGRSNEFITDREISYIMENMDDTITEEMKIEILKYINKINNNIFNKYDISIDSDDDAISEEDLIETNLKEEDLTNLLLQYNIDFKDFDEKQKIMLLKYGNLDNIEELLEYLKDEHVLYKIDYDILTRTFVYSSVKGIDASQKAIGIPLNELVEKIPVILYPTITERKYSVPKGHSPFGPTARSGCRDAAKKNSEFLKSIGINVLDVWESCPSFFAGTYRANKENIEALEFYGIPLKDKDGHAKKMFSIMDQKNPSVIDAYDIALESNAKEYALSSPSSLHQGFYTKFYLIKLAFKMGMSFNDIFGFYNVGNNKLFLKQKNLNHLLNGDLFELYDAVRINIPNKEIYDNVFEISNLNTIPSDVYTDENIKALEIYSENDELYNFNGVRISKKKVLRRYGALKLSDKADSMASIMYCITYGSMLDEIEFKNVYESVKKCVNLKADDRIYGEKFTDINKKSGGMKND